MASRNITCDVDAFAASLESLLGDIPGACGDACERAVQNSVRKTASELREGKFGSSGKTKWSDEYMGGFASSMNRKAPQPEGEVGNKAKPGLVHLVEKGHVTLTGRRTQAYPHMEPAFNAMSEEFVEQARRYVMEALR